MPSTILNDKNIFSYLILTSVFVGAYTIAPLLAMKIAQIGPLTLPAGDFIYALTFVCTDIANEVFGKKYARNIVKCGLITLIFVYLFTQIAVFVPSASFWEGEETYNEFFGTGFRIFLATICAYLLSQLADIYIFSWIKEKTKDKALWLRNNVSTFIARLLDIVTFVLIAFYGVFENAELISIIVSGYIAGIIISIIDTPFVYAGVNILRKMHPELKQTEEIE